MGAESNSFLTKSKNSERSDVSRARACETMPRRPLLRLGPDLHVRRTPRLLKNLKAEFELIRSVFFRKGEGPSNGRYARYGPLKLLPLAALGYAPGVRSRIASVFGSQ